jgi:HlyD family secretion protein
MTRRHWLYLVGAVVLLAGVLVWAFRPQPVPVEAAEVRSGRFELAIEEDGKTRVRERYVVSAPLAGRLARITLKPGDAVKAGMPVATLWPSAPAMIDARTFRELNERVGAAEAGWQQARANVAREEASLEKAQTDLARQQKLQGEGFVSPSALDQAQLSVRVQAKALEAARFARDGAAHDVAQARAALMRAQEGAAIKRPGSAWPIVSPVDGRVLRVLQESESVVALGAPLVEVADPRDLEVVIDVLSTEGARIAGGARVELDAGAGLRLQGRVRRVEPAAFTKVSALGVEEQRVNVIVDLVTPAEQWQALGDQFRVDARIIVLEQAAATVVPVAAFFRAPGASGEDWAVFVIRGTRAEQRAVKIGARGPLQAWVSSGLVAGERVIVYPSDRLTDGGRIKVVRGRATP